MHSSCIRVDSSLSACKYTAPIHSTGPHPHTSLLSLSHTYGRLIPDAQLLPAARGATSEHVSCKSCSVRPRRTAAHFFPHTRPPDTPSHFSQQHQTSTHSLESRPTLLEYQGSLLNTYFSLVLSSMPGSKQRGRRMAHRPRPVPAVVRPRDVLHDNQLDEASDLGSVDGARDMSMSFAREGSGDFDSRGRDGGCESILELRRIYFRQFSI